MNKQLFNTSVNIVEKLDTNVLKTVNEYESLKLNLHNIRFAISESFNIFNKYSIVIDGTSRGFDVNYNVYLEDGKHLINFDISFFQGKLIYGIFFHYNSINVVDVNSGVIVDEISQKCMEIIEE